MIPYMTCASARDRLEGFIDGELPVDDQVAVEAHLRWCRTCAARVEDLQTIGTAIGVASQALRLREDDADEASMGAGVLMRIIAEHEQSFAVRLRDMFSDRRLLWPACGATIAVCVCLSGVFGMLRLISSVQPDSLAAMLDVLAHPGSDANPMRLDVGMTAPRVIDTGISLARLPEDEAVFALRTVVTREGRIESPELIQWQRATVHPRGLAAQTRDVTALLDAVRASRFTPAQEPGGQTVAVNMVWLIARTTVKGSSKALDFELPTATVVRPPRRAKPAAPRPVREQSSIESGLPTA